MFDLLISLAILVGKVLLVVAVIAGLIFGGRYWLRIPRYVLGTSEERERGSQAITQFMIGDLIWLVVLLQFAMAPVVAYVPRERIDLYILFFGYAVFAAIAVWWGTMRMVSKAGIRSQNRRGVLAVVVAPLTMLIMVLFATPLLALPIGLSNGGTSSLELHFFRSLGYFALVTWPIDLPMLWVLRRLALWALDDPLREKEEPDDAEAAERSHKDEKAADTVEQPGERVPREATPPLN